MDYMDMLTGGDKPTNNPVNLCHTSTNGRTRINVQHAFVEAATDLSPEHKASAEIMSCFRQDRYGKTR